MDYYDYQQVGTSTAAPHHDRKPMPSREELIKRNSFPGPDKNRHLDRMLREGKK